MVERLKEHNRQADEEVEAHKDNEHDKRSLHDFVGAGGRDYPVDLESLPEVQQARGQLRVETPGTTPRHAQDFGGEWHRRRGPLVRSVGRGSRQLVYSRHPFVLQRRPHRGLIISSLFPSRTLCSKPPRPTTTTYSTPKTPRSTPPSSPTSIC